MSDLPADERVALFRRAFELYAEGQVEEMLELYDPEVEVTAPEWMNAGPFQGHEGYLEWTRRFNEAWGTLEFEVRQVEAVGDRHVVGEVLTRGRGSGSGVEVEHAAGWVVEFRDGRGIYIEVTLSVDSAFELARRREPGSA